MGEKRKRLSAKKKTDCVLRLLRGESIEEVARDEKVTIADLTEWRNDFIQSGTNGFKKNPEDSVKKHYEKIIVRLEMEKELLKKKEDFIVRNQSGNL